MPKLRDSIMRQRRGGDIETFTDTDDRGDLTMWQEGGYDMDPQQYGIQDKPYEFGPPDETTPPIFMTNIPQGGIGPSITEPGGVPGSELDRADIDARAAEAGVDVMDLSQKQKTKAPPAWVDPDVDLNGPGERDKFKQSFRQTAFGGIDLPDVDPIAEAAKKWDPAIYPDEFKQLSNTLMLRVKSARDAEDRVMAEFDKNAAIQASARKRMAESEKASGTDILKKRERYIQLGKDYAKILTDRQKLVESLGTTFDETAKDALNVQIQELDRFSNDIKFQMKGFEGIPGIKPIKVNDETMASHTPTGQGQKQTGAQKFAVEGKAKGWSPEQTLAEWKKLKTSGAGGKAGTKSVPVKPVSTKPAPAKIVKPAQPYGKLSEKQIGMKSDVDYAKQFLIDVGNFTAEMFIGKPAAEIMRLYNEMKSSVRDPRAGLASGVR